MRRSTTTGRRSVGLYCVNQMCCSALDNVSLSVQESLSLRRAVDTRLHPPSLTAAPATVTYRRHVVQWRIIAITGAIAGGVNREDPGSNRKMVTGGWREAIPAINASS